MIHPNLHQLATRIHAQNKAAGWWDIPRPRVQTAWLVVTELAEATEAERKGRYADLEAFELAVKAGKPWNHKFRDFVKDSFEDEIADAVIRLLDFAASEGIDIDLDPSDCENSFDKYSNEISFFFITDNLLQLANYGDGLCYDFFGRIEDKNIIDSYSRNTLSETLGYLIIVSRERGFDLWHHVELKLKYNATRGKVHGGKKF